MSVFRCKMCGGTIEFNPGDTIGVCDSCGTKQTLPRLDDDKKANLYDRANHFRRNNDFDKAMGIYEQILNEDNTDAEAYWSLVLCRFGIEYVEDPATHKRVPTVNRAQYTSIFADEDYKSALQYADSYQRLIYEDEAKAIDNIQKGILEISQKEEPFDVFICYKETDANGRRTQDSVLANDLYHQLTQEGFKVFFSRITLEDKLGTAYEPYIFAALNSAKVMVVLGTRPEYFSAVWVKNEWSRYLALVKNSGGKKMLIPAYKDMDPYDLPEEFSHLQAQDMSKLGFMQDLIRGIKKIIATDAPKAAVKETVVAQQSSANTTANAQIKRGNMALEDHDWAKADSFFEEALNLDPECAEAYIGKLLAKAQKPGFDSWLAIQKARYADATTERLEACPEDTGHVDQKAKELAIAKYLAEDAVKQLYVYDRGYNSTLSCRKKQKEKQLSELSADRLLSRARQYADGDTKKQLDDAIAAITAALDERIAKAVQADENSIARIRGAYAAFIAEADKKAETLNEKAQNRREYDYQKAAELQKRARSIGSYEYAMRALKEMDGYKDSDALAEQCQKEVENLKAKEKKEQEEAAKKRKRIIAIRASVAAACIVFVFVLTKVIIPNSKYNSAVALMNEGKIVEAYENLIALNGYKDSAEKASEIFSQYEIEKIKIADVGDTLLFGAYEQDNDTSNGQENIEWQVLDKKDGKVLVISKYALDCQQYNEEDEGVTWETCNLRRWLNRDFYNAAFSEDVKKAIMQTTVTADKNPKCDTNPGSSTIDNVFLLSITEAEKYFSDDDARMCAPTAYAIAQGAYTNSNCKTASGEASCWWWLRSPGEYQDGAAYVFAGGSVCCGGLDVYGGGVCVRPALWINLAS